MYIYIYIYKSPATAKGFLHATMSRPAVGPTHPPTKWTRDLFALS